MKRDKFGEECGGVVMMAGHSSASQLTFASGLPAFDDDISVSIFLQFLRSLQHNNVSTAVSHEIQLSRLGAASRILTFHRSYRNLPPRTRIGVGIAVLAWGTVGLYISDTAEKKLGFEPSEKEKQALEAVVPKITVVEREKKS
jgi:hypothetical protein